MLKSAKKIAEGLAVAWSSGNPEEIASFSDDCIFEHVCDGGVYRGQEELKTQTKPQDFIDLEVKEILCKPHFRFWRYGSLMALVNAK